MLGALVLAQSAYAEIAVVVGVNSDIKHMDKNVLVDIYMSKISATPEGVAVIPLDNTGKARSHFYRVTVNKSLHQLRKFWSHQVAQATGEPPKELDSDQEILDVVSKNPNTLGYIDKAHINDQVRVLLTLP
ncbi:MAG: hypothetical protein HKM02_02840 [Pseudomonadales bacterium]|nr:hypothetical protein [Pseudomonadales bacterium]